MAAVIQNPLNALGDQFYREAIEHCRSYNARLCAERSVRLPFLDSQTGVAQNNCYIWMERHHRGPGVAAGQMYTYPARCWRKKRRLHTSMDSSLHLYGLHIDGSLSAREALPTPSTTLEALLRGDGLDKRNSSRDEESLLEIQRVLEADANEDGYHDDEDFEVDIPKRKHRGKGRGRGSGRRRSDLDDQDKPYIYENRYKQKHNSKTVASVCGKRYRNRTGLSYHYGHSHIAEKEGSQARDSEPSQSPAINHRPHSRRQQKSPDAGHARSSLCSVCRVNSGSKLKEGKCSKCAGAGGRDGEKDEKTFAGAEELFGTTSESDTSTFHGFEEDELDEPLSNTSETSPKGR
ncbi:zinc finger protein DPF3-like [Brachyhypopomus gauderio]|uniref:zinc finger protein DPF3-like n=1 Tax=Brachyhypopomus gauderio TaxID=698409 RepID=UPI004041ABCE